MDILLGRFHLDLKLIKPRKRERRNMILIRRNRESGLDRAKGFIVILEKVSARGERRIGESTFEFSSKLLEGLEIILEILGLAFSVVQNDVVSDWAVQIEAAVGFPLEDCQH